MRKLFLCGSQIYFGNIFWNRAKLSPVQKKTKDPEKFKKFTKKLKPLSIFGDEICCGSKLWIYLKTNPQQVTNNTIKMPTIYWKHRKLFFCGSQLHSETYLETEPSSHRFKKSNKHVKLPKLINKIKSHHQSSLMKFFAAPNSFPENI